MKHPVFLCLFFAALLLHRPVALADGIVLKVGASKDLPPLSYVETTKYTGFEVELLRNLTRIMGVGFELRTLPLQELLPALQNQKFDAVLGGVPTGMLRGAFDHTTPHLRTGHGLLVRADDETIKSLEDLNDKTVGTGPGPHALFFFQDNAPGALVSMFPFVRDAYLQLESHDVDAVYHHILVLRHYAAHKGKGHVKVLDAVHEPMDYSIAVRKNSPWKARFDDALLRFEESGGLDKLKKKWFGEKPAENNAE